MAKGIIVVDMPETCRHIRGEKEKGCPFGGMVCQVTQRDVMEHLVKGSKPYWCPVRPIPERVDEHDTHYDSDYYRAEGYNACLDEIEGKMQSD